MKNANPLLVILCTALSLGAFSAQATASFTIDRMMQQMQQMLQMRATGGAPDA